MVCHRFPLEWITYRKVEGQVASEVGVEYGIVVAAIDGVDGVDGFHTEISSEDEESKIVS